MHTVTHEHTHVHITHMHIHIPTCTHCTLTCTYLYIPTHTHGHIYIYTYSHTHTHKYTSVKRFIVWGTAVKISGLGGGVTFHRAQLPAILAVPSAHSPSSLHPSSTAHPTVKFLSLCFVEPFCCLIWSWGQPTPVSVDPNPPSRVFLKESLESQALPSCFKYCYE